MPDELLHPRFAESALERALADSPIVLIHGPRQSGKTTLARVIGRKRGYTYFSFDDDVTREAATSDPAGFVADLPETCILDEVQRVPALFTSMKAAVDRDRRPGRFLLTGSANVLLVPKLADSLAGRMELLRLHPLAQCELAHVRPGFLGALFAGRFKGRNYGRLGRELATRIVAGGYPAALARSTPKRRAVWYRDYIETLVQRDVRELARIASLDVLPRLLTLAAGQTARLLNVSDLAAPFQISRPTIKDYVTLLERVFLLETLAPWHSNRLSRLVKAPEAAPRRYRSRMCAPWARCRESAGRSANPRAATGDFRFPGAPKAGELARGRRSLSPLSRQGWRGGRSGPRAWRTGARRSRNQGFRDGHGRGLPRPAEAARRGGEAICGRRRALRWRGWRVVRGRVVRGPDSCPVGARVNPAKEWCARQDSNLRPSAPHRSGRRGRRNAEIEYRHSRGPHWTARRPDLHGTSGTRRHQICGPATFGRGVIG